MSPKKTDSNRKKMSDIASLAGVSESTVSRALAGSKLVSDKTRERILELAREHKYVVNKQAQNLRLQSSKTVSVVIPIDHEPQQHVSDPFFLELLGAIADSLSEKDYDLLLSRVHRRSWQERVLSRSYVDGLIIIGQSDLHNEINEFAQQNYLPMVVWGAELDQQNYLSVGSDNQLGGQLATEYLVNKGCKQIAFLGDPSLPEVNFRFLGYRTALNKAGIEFDPLRLVPAGFSRESGLASVNKLIASRTPFDAIVAASDVLAVCAIKVLLAEGLHVPDQVSVIGYDDIAIANNTTPTLSTISQDIAQGGRSLVAILLDQLEGKPVKNHLIKPKLIIRQSA